MVSGKNVLGLLVLLHAVDGYIDVACSRVDVKPRLRRPTLTASAPIVVNAEADLQAAAPPLPRALPCGDALDKRIWTLALPAFVNFLILPITGAVDLFCIGKLGSALATAGQPGLLNSGAAHERRPQYVAGTRSNSDVGRSHRH